MKKSDQTSTVDSIGKVAECTGCGHKLTDEEIAAYVELARSGSYSRRAVSKETVRDFPLPSGGSITLRVPTAESRGTLMGKWLGQAFKNDNPIHALADADVALPKGGCDARRLVTRQDLLNHLFDPNTTITATPTLFNPTPAFASALQLAWLSRPGTPFQKAFKGFNKKAKLFAGKVKK